MQHHSKGLRAETGHRRVSHGGGVVVLASDQLKVSLGLSLERYQISEHSHKQAQVLQRTITHTGMGQMTLG